MRRLTLLGAALAFAIGGIIAVQPAAAAAPTAPADTSTVQWDVCIVLQNGWDPQHTAYYLHTAQMHLTDIFAGKRYWIVKCLFVPKTSPNYGSLCQQASAQAYPVSGPWTASPVVPRWQADGTKSPLCPD